jgi:hypothetical protein
MACLIRCGRCGTQLGLYVVEGREKKFFTLTKEGFLSVQWPINLQFFVGNCPHCEGD